MKKQIIDVIEADKDAIIACGEYILNNPELGFKEYKTSEYVKQEFKKLGISYKENLAVTGVMGVVGNPDADVNICMIGEMDAVKCYEHPYADSVTGTARSGRKIKGCRVSISLHQKSSFVRTGIFTFSLLPLHSSLFS